MSDQLQVYRRIVLDCDFVNDWVPPIIASTGDLNGRIIVAKVTNNGSVVAPSEKLHAQLLVNPKPNDEGYFGDYVRMEPVSGYETAAFSCAIPYGAVSKPGRTRMGVAFLADNDDGTQDIICTRPFNVEVEQGVLRVDSDSAIGNFEENVRKAEQSAANAAESAENAALANSAAASSASSAADSADSASNSAERAATSASNASRSESAAAGSAAAAESSANAASGSATAAKKSQDAAASSATSAAESASQAHDLVENFNLTVGETTTSEPGGNAVVEITKQGTVYTADFTIPRGEQGPRGENTMAITSVTGSVDNNVGVPSIDVVAGGTPEERTLDFQFHNLKGGVNEVQHTADLTGAGTTDSPLGVADTVARKTDIPSDYVSDSELATKLGDYVTTESLNSTLNGYATDTELSGGLQSEAAEREKQDGLLEQAISGKIAAPNVKAGPGIATHVSGNDVTVSASPNTINVTFEASLFSEHSLSARKPVNGLGSVNMVSPKASAANIAACQACSPWLADHADDSSIPDGQVQCTVSSVPTADIQFVVTVLKG